MHVESLPGSLEALKEELRMALRDVVFTNKDEYFYIEATFPDYVLVNHTPAPILSNPSAPVNLGKSKYLKIPYEKSEEGYEFGEPVQVALMVKELQESLQEESGIPSLLPILKGCSPNRLFESILSSACSK